MVNTDPFNIGLFGMKKYPEEGARPAFLGPPHTLVLLQIDAALRALRDPP
jgi:hypothetical protein